MQYFCSICHIGLWPVVSGALPNGSIESNRHKLWSTHGSKNTITSGPTMRSECAPLCQKIYWRNIKLVALKLGARQWVYLQRVRMRKAPHLSKLCRCSRWVVPFVECTDLVCTSNLMHSIVSLTAPNCGFKTLFRALKPLKRHCQIKLLEIGRATL